MSRRCRRAARRDRGTALGAAELLNPLDGGPHARFLAFRSPRAQRWHAELKAKNCITDVRGDVLRIGFGIYQDEDDVERLVAMLGGAFVSEAGDGRRAAGPGAAAARLHPQFPRPADPRHPRPADQGGPRLTDSQFGEIGGLAFALFYSVLAHPVRPLADRTSRSAGHRGGLALWSAFTALCGAAVGFWQLFLSRMGVGDRRGGRVAPSYALIADYFPPERRRGRWRSSRSEFRSAARAARSSAPVSPRRSTGARHSWSWALPGFCSRRSSCCSSATAAGHRRGRTRLSRTSSRSLRASPRSGCCRSPRR